MIEFVREMSIAFCLTFGGLHFLLNRDWAEWLAIDVPNDRSLHHSPVPRVGGVVLIPSTLLCSLAGNESTGVLAIIVASLCATSFIDDRWGLPIVVRFAVHCLAVTAYCSSILPFMSIWALVTALIFLVWSINLYNFMDGADGLAGGMAIFGFATYGWLLIDPLPALANLAFTLSAASAAFLIFNFSPARVFMGDAGSIPMGFLAGAIGLAGWSRGVWPIWFPWLLFSPFVVDASLTLVRRALRGEKFWHAHRDHYYQRLVRMGWSHRKLALAEYVLMAASVALGTWLLQADFSGQLLGLTAWAGVYAVLVMLIDNHWTTVKSAVKSNRGEPV